MAGTTSFLRRLFLGLHGGAAPDSPPRAAQLTASAMRPDVGDADSTPVERSGGGPHGHLDVPVPGVEPGISVAATDMMPAGDTTVAKPPAPVDSAGRRLSEAEMVSAPEPAAAAHTPEMIQAAELAGPVAHSGGPPASDEPTRAQAVRDEAALAAASGDWPLAAERWRALADLAPDDADAHLQHAAALQRLGQAAEATKVLTGLVQRFPEHAGALHDLARLAEQRQDWPAAEHWWRAFNAIISHFWWSHSALVGALVAQERPEEAEAVLQAALSRFPEEPNLLAEQARIAQGRGDWPVALQAWDQVIERFPAAWAGYSGKVAALAAMGRAAEADDALLSYAALLPDDPSALHDVARRVERHQEWTAAEADWRGFLRQEQRVDWAFIGLAQALVHQGRLTEAETCVAEAMERLRGSVDLVTEAARISEARGRHAEAAARWRTVARLAPGSPAGAIGEATALARHGDAAGADAVLEAALHRLTDEPALHIAYAEAAITRGDWAAALARLQAAQGRFPGVAAFTERMTEIETRRTAGADAIDAAGAQADRARALLLSFESLGGAGGQGGAFARAQRAYGAEPLGLLRWAEIEPDALGQALETEFAGIGEGAHTVVAIPPGAAESMYWCTDRRTGMTMPSLISADAITPEAARDLVAKRSRFLRLKLRDELRSGSKIFVYTTFGRDLTAAQLDRLHRAFRQYGDSTLFCLRTDRPADGVVWDRPGLLIGGLLISGIDHGLEDADAAGLLAICARARALWQQRGGAADAPSERNSDAGVAPPMTTMV